MADKISLTPSELYSGSSTLLQQRDTMNEAFTAAKAKVREVLDNWQGDARQKYEQQFTELYPSVNKLMETLDTFANNMRVIGETVEENDRNMAAKMG